MCERVSLAVFTSLQMCVFVWDISASVFLNVCGSVFINLSVQMCTLVSFLPK